MRTLLELSDGLASNAFGTHLGYGAALRCQLHWIDVKANRTSQICPQTKLRRRKRNGANGNG